MAHNLTTLAAIQLPGRFVAEAELPPNRVERQPLRAKFGNVLMVNVDTTPTVVDGRAPRLLQKQGFLKSRCRWANAANYFIMRIVPVRL